MSSSSSSDTASGSSDSEEDYTSSNDGSKVHPPPAKKKLPPAKNTKANSSSSSSNLSKKAAAASRHRQRLSSSEPFANLITAALKSHKKQEQSKRNDEVKNDVMGLIQAKLLGSGGSDATAKRSKDAADNESGSSPTTELSSDTSMKRRDYVKRIQGAYKDMKRNGDLHIGGTFNSNCMRN